MPFDEAEKYLHSCSVAAAAVAHNALRHTLEELSDYQVKSACVLLASGRALPELPGMLASMGTRENGSLLARNGSDMIANAASGGS